MSMAAIYCRVSSTDQKDNGTSLETQEAAARLKAAQLGLTVSEEYVICEDWSGTDLERPGLLRLLYLAEAGLIEVVIILCSDRLYRPEIEGDEWRIFPILQRFIDAGVELV
jgi:site-specific DNA recombinase